MQVFGKPAAAASLAVKHVQRSIEPNRPGSQQVGRAVSLYVSLSCINVAACIACGAGNVCCRQVMHCLQQTLPPSRSTRHCRRMKGHLCGQKITAVLQDDVLQIRDIYKYNYISQLQHANFSAV